MDHTEGSVMQIEEVIDEFFNNDEKFFERAVSIEALQRAGFELKSKPGMFTPATDEITLSGISKKWFVIANQKLLAGTFKFPNRRRMSIDKSGGGKRPLTLSNHRIKIIEKALLNAVEPHFEGLYR
jgi:retron-type reverse transcriptase